LKRRKKTLAKAGGPRPPGRQRSLMQECIKRLNSQGETGEREDNNESRGLGKKKKKRNSEIQTNKEKEIRALGGRGGEVEKRQGQED